MISKPVIQSAAADPLSNLTYKFLAVIKKAEEIIERKKLLYRAMILGNSYRTKAEIVVSTSEGEKNMNASIWAVTENYIVLKGGIFIPINCIKEVKV